MRSIAVFYVFCFCLAINAQNRSLNLSKWHDGDKIDKSDYQLIKKSKINCSISNDNDFIYMNLMVPDKLVSERILEEGLTIWVDMDGKQQKKMGIRFPLGSENPLANKNHSAEKNNEAEDLISQANTIELIGFISEQDRHFAAQNSDNFRGSVKYGPNGELFYRLLMPVSKLPLRNSRSGNGAMPFNLGLEIGYVPLPKTKVQAKNESHNASVLYWINDVRLASSK